MMKPKPKSKLALATAAAVERRQAPKKRVFLRELAKLPSVSRAAALAKIDRTTIYKWKQQDADFAAKWKEALDQSVDDVEARAFELALRGEDNVAGRLIEFLLRCHRPEVYRERTETGIVGGIVLLPAKREEPE